MPTNRDSRIISVSLRSPPRPTVPTTYPSRASKSVQYQLACTTASAVHDSQPSNPTPFQQQVFGPRTTLSTHNEERHHANTQKKEIEQ